MKKNRVRLTESQLRDIVKESVDKILKEADRHREGYWKERWAKQKAAKQAENASSSDDKSHKKPKSNKKDRHRKGYYHDYNQAHPSRLNRGFTKGYNNGNVNDGPTHQVIVHDDDEIIGFDELGRPITRHPLADLLRNKEMEWHDDDWCEEPD